MISWVWRNNGGLMSEDGRTVTFTDPRTVEGLQWYADLDRVHNVTGGNFQDGRSASMVTVHTGWHHLIADWPFEAATAPPPIPEGGQRKTLDFYKELIIFRSTPEREQAAWTFIKWLMEPERIAPWFVQTGYLPVGPDILRTELYSDFLADNPKLMPWIDELNYLHDNYATFRGADDVKRIFEQAIGRVRAGEPAAVVLEQLQPLAQAAVDEHYR